MKFAINALVACALTTSGTAALAQAPAAPAAAPAPAILAVPAQRVSGRQTVLPANTELLLSMNDELTTKGIEEGHKFRLSVVHDVVVDGHVVIPRGTPATGEVTWKTGKGAFGKSGKMEIALRYLDLGGRAIPIEGTYRQEGEGNTAATIAGVIAAGVFAGFITGKSARIPQGRELKAHTKEALPVVLASAPAPVAGPAVVATPVVATTAPANAAAVTKAAVIEKN